MSEISNPRAPGTRSGRMTIWGIKDSYVLGNPSSVDPPMPVLYAGPRGGGALLSLTLAMPWPSPSGQKPRWMLFGFRAEGTFHNFGQTPLPGMV